MSEYYNVERARTEAIIESIQEQSAANAAMRVEQMKAFSRSSVLAAQTEGGEDDVAIAMMTGFMMAQPNGIELPKLPPIKAPEQGSDIVRAWTPLVGMAIPFLYPLLYNSSNSGGTRVTADNGGTVLMDSANTASYNRSSGDMMTDLAQNGINGANNDSCADCGDEVEGEAGGQTLPEDFECTTDGYLNTVTGKWYTSAAQTCSCGSYEAGEC